MKKFWSIMFLMAVITVPSFAQLTPSDSTITNNGGAGITGSVVLDKNKVYKLQGFVYVRNGGTITIPAGTLILGETSSQGSLIIERGGKIFANGTATEPIVFTSEQPVGSRSRGDWGGIVICGKAANNRPGGNFVVEGNIGSIAGYGDGGIVQDDDDNSGVMRYVRIEFSGIPFTPNNEINGLTLGAVGRGTVIEHIMVSYNGDDGFEFFGGTVNCKWLISYKNYDDDLDTDFGYSGKIQFAFIYRDPNLADVSNSEAFESDNDGTGTTAAPRTSPVFSNVTVIGPKRVSTDVSGTNFNALFFNGVHHRRSTRMNLFNSVITGFDEGGIVFDGTTVLGDTSNFHYGNNTWAGHSTWVNITGGGSTTPYVNYLTARGNNSLTEPNDVLLKAPFNQNSPVLIPQAGSPLLGTASFTHALVADPFFTSVTYRGAFSGNGAERWDLGWANFDPQGKVYGNPNLAWSSIINLTSGNGASKQVVIGRGNGATDGVDASFGEANLPPVPPAGVIDLRSDLPGSSDFVSVDIRSNTTTSSVVTYTILIQAGSPSGSVQVLNWDPNGLGAGQFTLKDGFGGAVFTDKNMKTVSSQVVTGLPSVVIEVETRFNQTLVVGADWNLISFPGLHPNSMHKDTLYRRRDVLANVFKFSAGYSSVDNLVPGEGYWMKHAAGNQAFLTYTWDGTVQSGVLYPKLNYSANQPYAANAGWNMIGGYEYNADVNFMRTMPENKKTGLVFKYVPASGYVSTSVLTPGLGHWVNLSAAANLYVPGSFAGTLGKNPLDELIKEDWGKIILTDAVGQMYTLYASDALADLNLFNLPPVPPIDIFDVRYGSQKFVEDLSNNQTIDFMGVVHPVTITVEGLNINIQDVVNGKIINTTLRNGESFKVENSNINKLAISLENIVPTEYTLEQNYPNPFNPSTTIKFSLPEVSNVRLIVYNTLGQKVIELVNSTLEAGSYSFNWDASKIASGLYFYELTTNNFSSVKKMMLLK